MRQKIKKYTLIALLAFLSLSVKAQEKFNGIGIFKLGGDTSILYNYALINKCKIKPFYKGNAFFAKTQNDPNRLEIFKLEINIKHPEDKINDLSECTEAKEFYCSIYEINGIKIRNIRLVYFNNQLVKFTSNESDEIEAAMNSKYGKSEIRDRPDTSNCLYNFTGFTRKLIAHTFSYEWGNGDISALSVVSEYFDDHCDKKYISYFTYSISNRELEKCELEGLTNRLNGHKPNISKDKLKDF
ncbi:MAG TPA: hypothetical protein VG367_09220 [Mucilaginibacter sp.]|jgi:hypothetical protein|nr:hypothetical protein [Mucilaginibacter sp.]